MTSVLHPLPWPARGAPARHLPAAGCGRQVEQVEMADGQHGAAGLEMAETSLVPGAERLGPGWRHRRGGRRVVVEQDALDRTVLRAEPPVAPRQLEAAFRRGKQPVEG